MGGHSGISLTAALTDTEYYAQIRFFTYGQYFLAQEQVRLAPVLARLRVAKHHISTSGIREEGWWGHTSIGAAAGKVGILCRYAKGMSCNAPYRNDVWE